MLCVPTCIVRKASVEFGSEQVEITPSAMEDEGTEEQLSTSLAMGAGLCGLEEEFETLRCDRGAPTLQAKLTERVAAAELGNQALAEQTSKAGDVYRLLRARYNERVTIRSQLSPHRDANVLVISFLIDLHSIVDASVTSTDEVENRSDDVVSAVAPLGALRARRQQERGVRAPGPRRGSTATAAAAPMSSRVQHSDTDLASS